MVLKSLYLLIFTSIHNIKSDGILFTKYTCCASAVNTHTYTPTYTGVGSLGACAFMCTGQCVGFLMETTNSLNAVTKACALLTGPQNSSCRAYYSNDRTVEMFLQSNIVPSSTGCPEGGK